MTENCVACIENGIYSAEEFRRNSDEKDKLIKRQFIRIEELENEVAMLQQERDALACDVNKLRFELEMSELKRINDLRASSMRSILPVSQSNHGTEGEAPLSSYCVSSADNERWNDHDAKGPTQKSSERPSCGPGPPLKQLRSYSVDNTSQQTANSFGRSRQRSISGNVGPKKAPIRRLDEEALKRSRLHNNQYELSQDLLDKQVEMLERRYGGVRARHAALTIQRAFRKYCMLRRFQDIANASKGEKRLSRRMYTLELDNKEWILYNAAHKLLPNYVFDHRHHHNHVESPSNGDLKSPLYYEDRDGHQNAHSYSVHHHSGQVVKSGDVTVNSFGGYSEHSGGAEVDGSVYYAPPNRLSNNVQWSNGGSKSGRFVSPSHSTDSADERHRTPRESLSSEDSAISCTCLGENENDDSKTLHRDAAGRRSLNTCTVRQPNEHLQRNAVRSSDISLGRRKVPPLIPKRTSSIVTSGSNSPGSRGSSGDSIQFDEASVTSSSSNGSSSGGSETRHKTCEASPVWKRKSLVLAEQSSSNSLLDEKRLSNISENSEDSLEGAGYCSAPQSTEVLSNYPGHSFNIPGLQTPHNVPSISPGNKVSEIQRKRQYRVGLNLFNKKPERGVRYLIHRGFLEATPQAVARFLITRKGLSKQMIGEYLGNLQSSFNMAALEYFVQELDLAGMQVDVALRKFQTFFRLPGEAQKIERLMEVFSHRYISCNHDIVSKFNNPDTVFVLAFAIIMLNTDLHTPNMKAEKRMKLEDFIKNLRGVDDRGDLDRDMLAGIYERIKANEFKPGSDHVTQVLKVQQTIVGKKPNLALPHRRLVCYCRLYEVYDASKKERPGVHQREVFLFNDTLMVTKIFSKKKTSMTYTFRQSFPLCGMSVTLFEAPYYPHGIRLSQRVDDKVLVTFNARNEHDRSKFVEDLKESILEMDEMENMRIETELEKQKMVRARAGENRDSGVADMEILPSSSGATAKDGSTLAPESGGSGSSNLKRSALSNSLLDLHEQQLNKPARRGSAGSLDSGMSISFQSNSAASTVSRDSSPQTVSSGCATSPSLVAASTDGKVTSGDTSVKSPAQQGFLGGLFGKKGRNTSKGALRRPADSSEV